MKKILIMGLPGAGKTTMAQQLISEISVRGKSIQWFNADEVRRRFNDWDFSTEGRQRQAARMYNLASECGEDFVICDFVAPTERLREEFAPDWIIWMDTIDQSRYQDTNRMFEPPQHYDFRITEQRVELWAPFIADHVVVDRRRPRFDWRQPTVQLLGRWQPWHAGHRALFERLLERTGQVIIQIRDVQGWQGSNPFAIAEVEQRIRRDLDPEYQGQYEIQVVPNIVHIGWGRGVGYTAGEETFDDSITQISATQIRREMGLT